MPLRPCTHCQAVFEDAGRGDFTPGSPRPDPEICPVCRSQSLVLIDARQPQGFFTDLSPRDFDGSVEWTPRSTRPTLTVEQRPDPERQREVVNARVSVLPEQDILSVNDNGGNGGFEFQAVQRNGQPIDGAFAVLDAANNQLTPVGPNYLIALLSRRRTDSLLVDVRQWPGGIRARPDFAVGRAAWFSFAFFLRVAAADLLDVDTLELDAGFQTWGERDGQPAAQAFLCDKLENGAGYCTRLAEPSFFEQLMAQADPARHGGLARRWLTGSHAAECDTSCNMCVRDFYNLPYHGLLDWRLALDMARLAFANVAPDLAITWGDIPNPWTRLLNNDEGRTPTVPAMLAGLNYEPHPPFEMFRAYRRLHRQPRHVRILLERHPLWTDDHPMYQQALAAARAQYPQARIEPLNPFLAIRRPAEYA